MRWTFKKETRGVALTDGKMFKKGDAIPVTVYDLYTDSRGGGSQTVEVYHYGDAPEGADSEPTMRPPRGQNNYNLVRTFELAKETSTGDFLNTK